MSPAGHDAPWDKRSLAAQRRALRGLRAWPGRVPRVAVERAPDGDWAWHAPSDLAGTDRPVRALEADGALSRSQLEEALGLEALEELHVCREKGLDDNALARLRAAPGLRRLRIEPGPGLTARGLRRLLAARPDLDAAFSRAWLSRSFPYPLCQTLHDVLLAAADQPDEALRARARARWPELLANRLRSKRLLAAAAGEVGIGLALSGRSALQAAAIRCLVCLHWSGADIGALLPQAVALLERKDLAITVGSELRELAAAGLSLAPLVPALAAAHERCPYPAMVLELVALARAQQHVPAARWAALVEAPRLLTWSLGEEDADLLALARSALASPRTRADLAARVELARWGLTEPRLPVRRSAARWLATWPAVGPCRAVALEPRRRPAGR